MAIIISYNINILYNIISLSDKFLFGVHKKLYALKKTTKTHWIIAVQVTSK